MQSQIIIISFFWPPPPPYPSLSKDELNNCNKTEVNDKDVEELKEIKGEGAKQKLIKKDQVEQEEEETQEEADNIDKVVEGVIKLDIKKEIIELNKLENSNSCDEHSHREQPIDWKPQDKCYFCVDGKLLTVNEVGELVAEVGPAQTEAELTTNRTVRGFSFCFVWYIFLHCQSSFQTLHESESESCGSSSEREVPTPIATNQIPLNNRSPSVASLLRGGVTPNMTSLESMAAHFAALQQLQTVPQLAQFYPGLLSFISFCVPLRFISLNWIFLFAGFFYQQLQQQMSPATAANTAMDAVPIISPVTTQHKPTTSAEQPLDLSAKSSTPGGSNAFKLVKDQFYLFIWIFAIVIR